MLFPNGLVEPLPRPTSIHQHPVRYLLHMQQLFQRHQQATWKPIQQPQPTSTATGGSSAQSQNVRTHLVPLLILFQLQLPDQLTPPRMHSDGLHI